MKAMLMAAALLAVPMAAHAADVDLFAEYVSICAPMQNDLQGVVAGAKRRGYAEVPFEAPEGIDTVVALAKNLDGQTVAAVVGSAKTPAGPGAPAQAITSCSVSAAQSGQVSADAARRWAGMPEANMGEASTEYFFQERGGKRNGIPSTDEAVVGALNSGGYGLLQIQQSNGFTSLTLTRGKLAK